MDIPIHAVVTAISLYTKGEIAIAASISASKPKVVWRPDSLLPLCGGEAGVQPVKEAKGYPQIKGRWTCLRLYRRTNGIQ